RPGSTVDGMSPAHRRQPVTLPFLGDQTGNPGPGKEMDPGMLLHLGPQRPDQHFPRGIPCRMKDASHTVGAFLSQSPTLPNSVKGSTQPNEVIDGLRSSPD